MSWMSILTPMNDSDQGKSSNLASPTSIYAIFRAKKRTMMSFALITRQVCWITFYNRIKINVKCVSTSIGPCLVPRPHFSSRLKRFGTRGPWSVVSHPFASDTSPKRIDREGLGKRRTGTRQVKPVVWFARAVVYWRCRSVAKSA